MKREILSSLLLIACIGSASAADLPKKAKLQAPVVTPAFTWAGPYIGVLGGLSTSQSRYDFAGIANSGTFFGNGGLLGGFVGANFQTGNFVYGIEADGAWANIKGGNACTPTSGLTCQVESGGLFTFRGRFGIEIGGMPQPISLAGLVPATNRWNDILLYGTAGGAVRTIQASIPQLGQSETTKLGWAIGGGLEIPVADNIVARAQYLFNDFHDFNCAPGCTGGVPLDTIVRMKEHVVTAGMGYKF